MLTPLPPTFDATRDSLHAVAEQVLAAARYRADKHIGLVPTPGGFGTPRYGDGEVARVDNVDIVYDGPHAERRSPITTLAAAAQCVDVPLGAPDVYPPATSVAPDTPLAIDPDAAHALAAWIALAGSLLDELRAMLSAQNPSSVQLWPEHFDLSCDLGDEQAGTRATYGASPGDDQIAEPYLYVGPWDAARKVGRFAEYSFGAALSYSGLRDVSDPKAAGYAFLAECAAQLLRA